MSEVFLLLLAFQIKHFIADYPLQGVYMLGKFKGGTEWIKPLAAHSAVHALFTFAICTTYGFHTIALGKILFLSGADFFAHFVIDRMKANPKLLGRFKPDQKYFWWALGFDQMAHHLTHYLIILALVNK